MHAPNYALYFIYFLRHLEAVYNDKRIDQRAHIYDFTRLLSYAI